jgi:hypothetical protein
MKRFFYATLCAIAVFLPAVASAGEVHNREVNQQRRIHNGVRQGKINKREYRHIERREAAINRTRRRDLRAHHGHLTPQEQRNLNHRLNNTSRTIYRDRHN